MSRPGGDRGSGTVLVLAVLGVLMTAAVTCAALAAVAVARHQALAAADLAALAAATRVDAGCTAAQAAARSAGAELASCRTDGRTAEVVAVVRPPGWLGGFGQARARARAGPVEPGGALE